MSSGNVSSAEPMSTEMFENISYGCQSHPSVHMRDACYKIRYHIILIQAEWKGCLLYMQNMGKGLQKVFKAVVSEILKFLSIFGESGSYIYDLISEPTI